MKSNLLLKFFIIYIAIIIVGFFCIRTISYSVNYKHVTQSTIESMYKEALAISSEYSDYYFSNASLKKIKADLDQIAKFTNIRILFLDTDGTVLLDTSSHYDPENRYKIEDFDFTLTGNKYYQTGNFYGFFKESTISVVSPIANNFTTKGYVSLHIPESTIAANVSNTFDSNYITFIIMMVLISLFILFYYVQVHKPLKEIMKGTHEYTKGNLNYRIKALNNDEIGRLGISLNYMSSELNEMDKFQQKFLSNISHDFRSPLTSIKGYLEAIQDGTIPPEKVNKYIEIVLFETERLTKLTSNILTLNELDPRTTRLNISTFDMNSVIRRIIELFDGICKEKKVSFTLIFTSKVLLVSADIEKIQQVLYNLVDNAIKFSPQNSLIKIMTNQKGDKAFISVKDHGCGISKESIDKIWDRFYKSDLSRGKDKKGSGLGLSIVKEIISLHNENIDVISTVGVGTEFIFTLPKGVLPEHNNTITSL